MSEILQENLGKDKIIQSIRSGTLKIRPRWHFILKSILLVSGVVLILIGLVSLFSFIIFILNQTGLWFVPRFGFRGVETFLISLPWILIFTSLIFIVSFEILIRKYRFGYKRPLMYSILAVISFAAIGGLALASTSVHSEFYKRARRGQLPLVGSMYRAFGNQHFRNVHSGVIIEEYAI
jgi:hypothetical protein